MNNGTTNMISLGTAAYCKCGSRILTNCEDCKFNDTQLSIWIEIYSEEIRHD